MSTRKKWLWALGMVALIGVLTREAWAQFPPIQLPDITINGKEMEEKAEVSTFIQVSLMLTTLSLAPYLLVMTTAFIRVTVTLSFLRTALGTQQVPPTQVLMALSLFLTMFIMAPVGEKMNREAIQPYYKGDIKQAEAFKKFVSPLQEFMLAQTRDKDLGLFLGLSKMKVDNRKSVPFYVLLPSYILSEIKTSFEIGFLLYIPFLVIDMIVASVLMSMGMFMLSPMTISLPFKLLMFVSIDGWHIIINGLVNSFNRIEQ